MTSQFITVFCGSSPGNSQIFLDLAKEVGLYLVQNNYGLVYGGGKQGIMGAIAKTVHENGGSVISVIVEAMYHDKFGSDRGYGEVIIAPDVHSRKVIMHTKSIAFLTLPGGFGTLAELLEMITWGQIGIHTKPVIALNHEQLYSPLKTIFNQMINNGFVQGSHLDLVIFIEDTGELKKVIEAYRHPENSFGFKWD